MQKRVGYYTDVDTKCLKPNGFSKKNCLILIRNKIRVEMFILTQNKT